MKFLQDEEQFVTSFLKSPREHCYTHLLFPEQSSTLHTKHLSDASVSHNVGGFVAEVKEYIYANVCSKQVPSVERLDGSYCECP